MEQRPHTARLKSKRTDDPTFNEGRAGNANARYEFVHMALGVCLNFDPRGLTSPRSDSLFLDHETE